MEGRQRTEQTMLSQILHIVDDNVEQHAPLFERIYTATARELALHHCIKHGMWKCAKLLRRKGITLHWHPDHNRLTEAGVLLLMDWGLGMTARTPPWVHRMHEHRTYCRRSVRILLGVLRRRMRNLPRDIVAYIARMVWETRANEEWHWTRAYDRDPSYWMPKRPREYDTL